jgi:hypothetical protein
MENGKSNTVASVGCGKPSSSPIFILPPSSFILVIPFHPLFNYSSFGTLYELHQDFHFRNVLDLFIDFFERLRRI